jgi:hypothetical protein
MKARTVLAALLLVASVTSFGQKAEQENKVPTAFDLQAITARGKILEEYDVAAWHATDVVQDMKPEKGSTRYYIAKKTGAGWIVVFGRLNETQNKFLVVYQATQGTKPEFFTAKRFDPPVEDTDFYLHAAIAFDAALKDLGPVNRPYNAYAIPSEKAQLYVYLLPAQTENDIYPLGGDVRYTFSADGSRILEKRQMHQSILEFKVDKTRVAGWHTHVLTLSPEDSDVFYVLTRKPSIPEYVGTLDRKIYVVQPDGTILLGK